jgi:hypothetical protein
MARALSALVLAVWLVGCGGSTFANADEPDGGAGNGNKGGGGSSGGDASAGGGGSSAGGGGSGRGGAAGTGGSGGAAGVGGEGGAGGVGGSPEICAPMPGCSSNTSCNDGCNTCSCFNGTWACTARACPVDAAPPDAPTRSCEQDSDCVYRTGSGCCGMCLATTDPVPPPLLCGAACLFQPSCVCINHYCGTGALGSGVACESSHDLCSPGLKCCAQCGGVTFPDGAPPHCSAPVCVQPAQGGTCPLGV